MYGNNWELVANPRRARTMLRRFARMNPPDGRIIAQTNGIYSTTSPLHLACHAWNRARGRMPGQVRLRVRSGFHSTPWFDYLMLSKPELEAVVSGTGWRVERFLDDPGSSIYVFVLVK